MQIQQQAEKFFCYFLKVGQISFPKRYNFLSEKAWFKSYEHFAKPRIFPKITARTGADLARAKRSQRVKIGVDLDLGPFKNKVYFFF